MRVLRTLRRALLAAVLLLGAPPAAAAELLPEPPYVADTTRVERIVAGLREDPLFVDPSAVSLLPREEAEAVREALADQPVPVYVVVVPSLPTDESAGDEEVLLHAVHHVLGEGGVYVHLNSSWLHSGSYRFSHIVVDVPVDDGDLPRSPVFAEGADELLDLLAAVRTAPPGAPASPTPSAVEFRDHRTEYQPTVADRFSGDFWPGLLVVGPLLGLLLFPLALGLGRAGRAAASGRRTRRAHRDTERRSLPAPLRARRAPSRPSRARLHRILRRELDRLTAELEAAAAAQPGRDRAARAFDAAGLLAADPAATDHDLVGAIVLAREGRAALAADGLSRSPGACSVNPLHGAPLPGSAPLRGSAGRSADGRCARCAGRTVPPPPLRLAGEPHTAHANLWTRTGYGRTVPELARTVLKEIDVD
ncbi:hypothetical protein FOF52_13080 [Thermobifida alba]|uniref:DUF4350 domain-containing protein n=1 Tax=Thermobifida alba TaxID=53522 RepID=A0ABY4L283_THEAE|nr:hypothetical protein [Thermobifida alba]UPT21769.1 hypothetical protein FOF52_13080 [Thermobifida alba]